MYKVTVTAIRPNTDVDFFIYDDDFADYIKEEYIDTGKLLSRHFIDVDSLTQECIFMFYKKEYYQEYVKDPAIQFQEAVKIRYNLFHRIAVSINVNDTTVTRDIYNLYQR